MTMWGETVCLGSAILVSGFLISAYLNNLDETIKRILKRYAALENLGLFPGEENDD